MEQNPKKKLWSRTAVILLLGVLLPLLLWGCSEGNHASKPPIQGADKESGAAAIEALNTGKDSTASPESELLDTKPKVIAYVEEMAQVGAEEFSLVCSDEIYDELLKVTYKGNRGEIKAIYSLLDQSGFYSYGIIPAAIKKTITITNISFYPGYEILRNVEAGTEAQLHSKLKSTLAEARSMADACRTSDPLETAKNIQSAICTKATYAYMTNKSHVDTAIGPLLNGVADCDGYADAFYLVGSLAGLEVRYQHGISSNYNLVENKIETGSHMWNLLKLDGSWRVVDVCWADGAEGIDFTWFNIGKDRASRSRTWLEDLTVPLLETTDLSTRPETEYSVNNYAELEAAVNEAINKGQKTFTIIYDNRNFGSQSEALDLLWNCYDGGFSYYWDEATKALTFILDDTESE